MNDGFQRRRRGGVVATFTGFEADHLDHHGTLEQYWASKAELFTRLAADPTDPTGPPAPERGTP